MYKQRKQKVQIELIRSFLRETAYLFADAFSLKNLDFIKSRGQPRGSPGSNFSTPENPGVSFPAGVGDIANPNSHAVFKEIELILLEAKLLFKSDL